MSSMKETTFNILNNDTYMKTIFKIIAQTKNGSNLYSYYTIKNHANIDLGQANIFGNSFVIGRFLWNLKNLTQTLFIKDIVIKSNLILENSGELTVSKSKADKSQRKKFNGRKFIDISQVTQAEISSGVIQTLAISIFRTFFDFDDTIPKELFDYLFNGKDFVCCE